MADFSIAVVRDWDTLKSLIPDWTRAFYAWATPNPFAHPIWLTTWARHFVAPGQLRILAVRDRDGKLAGVAPFYRYSRLGMSSLQLLGTGQHERLTELPQVLTRPGDERPVLRAVLQHLIESSGDRDGWDWLELSLTAAQGWLEPEWIPDSARAAGAFRLPKTARPCVVLPLPARWDDLRSGLKRNLKESLRRGVNSLAREGRSWSVSSPLGAELAPALQTLVALHTARADIDEKIPHANYFEDPADIAFMRDAVGRLAAVGHGGPQIMQIDGAPAAGRLILHANGVTFFSFSGFNPQWWSYNTPTTLMGESLRAAIGRGDRVANLSLGPDVAKLRWSNHLDIGHDFVIVAPHRRSRLAFSVFWQVRAAAFLQRERRASHRPAMPTPMHGTSAATPPRRAACNETKSRALAG